MNHQVIFLSPEQFSEKLKTSVLTGGVVSAPYGSLAVRGVDGYICALAFLDKVSLDQPIYRLPFEEDESWKTVVSDIQKEKSQKLMLVGTPFQHQVWGELLKIPKGTVKNYQDIAKALGDANKSRPVGTAVGANPISWIVPCHRVLPKSGGIGQYHWGPEIKRELLKDEGYVSKAYS